MQQFCSQENVGLKNQGLVQIYRMLSEFEDSKVDFSGSKQEMVIKKQMRQLHKELKVYCVDRNLCSAPVQAAAPPAHIICLAPPPPAPPAPPPLPAFLMDIKAKKEKVVIAPFPEVSICFFCGKMLFFACGKTLHL